MPETTSASVQFGGNVRHRGRISQVRIYLGKFFRMFIFQNDWKVLPMAAVISALVGMVVQSNMFVTMEGTLFGAFALSCVCIWNGCFNSIQVVCRERGIIKREHRSGMHISSYVVAHMIYQAFLCLAQAVLMTIVCMRLGVRFPAKGFITGWFPLDFAISIFLITYASDMLGLFISSLVHTTTMAMTIMPFLLIVQLIFSGGFFSLPSWSQPLTNVTVSRYGLRSIAALGDYNELPAVTAWNTLSKMTDTEVGKVITTEDVIRVLQNETVRAKLREVKAANGTTMESIADLLLESGLLAQFEGGEYDLHLKLSEIIDAIGEEKVETYINEAARIAGHVDDYDQTVDNIVGCWFTLIGMSLLFAALSVVSLEFIDKDKR